MAVTAKLIHDGRSLEASLDGRREYRRTYQVITTDPLTDEQVVLLAPGIPGYLDAYTSPDGSTVIDVYARVVRKRARADAASRLRWLVEVEYSTDLGQTSYTDNPLDKPADYNWSFGAIERVITKDADNKQIRNSAGDVFNPQPVIDEPILVFQYSKNIPFDNYDPIKAAEYFGAVNSDGFLGFGVGKCRCSQWTAAIQYTKTFAYWSSSIEIQIRHDGWELELADRGLREKVGNELKHIRIKTGTGNEEIEVTEPVFLDGSGKLLPPNSNINYLKFKPYRVKSFAALGISYP